MFFSASNQWWSLITASRIVLRVEGISPSQSQILTFRTLQVTGRSRRTSRIRSWNRIHPQNRTEYRNLLVEIQLCIYKLKQLLEAATKTITETHATTLLICQNTSMQWLILHQCVLIFVPTLQYRITVKEKSYVIRQMNLFLIQKTTNCNI